MNTFSHVPPGFRFHPTDEELVDYYLRKKVNSRRIDLDVIKDVDLYKIEPWDLQEICRIGTEGQNEWYFFSHKDKKYPTGTRTNRATAAGFWKATGRDKAIYSKHDLIGMRKTLVFYKGRAPNGQKSDWIMHEYRLETDENGTPQEEGWVVCRVFKKRITTMRKVSEHESSSSWYDDHVPFMQEEDSPKINPQPPDLGYHLSSYSCKKELEFPYHHHEVPPPSHDHFLQLPLLQSPKLLQPTSIIAYGLDINQETTLQSSPEEQQPLQTHDRTLNSPYTAQNNSRSNNNSNNNEGEALADPVTDWRVLDKFVASQLSQEDVSKQNNNNFSNAAAANSNIFHASDQVHMLAARHLNRQETTTDNASTSTPAGCQIEFWK